MIRWYNCFCVTGICKKKVRENFKYIKSQIIEHIDLVIEEIEKFQNEVLNEDQLYELLELGKLRKTENLLKHLIRKGEECCKYLLQSFESESIEKTFILYDILGFEGLLFFVFIFCLFKD